MSDEQLDETRRRLFDITIPVALAQLSQELKDFKEEINKKLDNGLITAINKLNDKVHSLPCDSRIEKTKAMELFIQDKILGFSSKINALYGAFVVVVIVGIVIGIWVKTILAHVPH